MVAQRYAELADSITHGRPSVEKTLIGPHFSDRAEVKLSAYEYDPLTIQVLGIARTGNALIVHAQYVGVQGKHETTVDRWLLLDGAWRLAQRD